MGQRAVALLSAAQRAVTPFHLPRSEQWPAASSANSTHRRTSNLIERVEREPTPWINAQATLPLDLIRALHVPAKPTRIPEPKSCDSYDGADDVTSPRGVPISALPIFVLRIACLLHAGEDIIADFRTLLRSEFADDLSGDHAGGHADRQGNRDDGDDPGILCMSEKQLSLKSEGPLPLSAVAGTVVLRRLAFTV